MQKNVKNAKNAKASNKMCKRKAEIKRRKKKDLEIRHTANRKNG